MISISVGASYDVSILPSFHFSCFTVSVPYGVGKEPSTHSRSPNVGLISITLQPGSLILIPNMCCESHAVGPDAQP